MLCLARKQTTNPFTFTKRQTRPRPIIDNSVTPLVAYLFLCVCVCVCDRLCTGTNHVRVVGFHTGFPGSEHRPAPPPPPCCLLLPHVRSTTAPRRPTTRTVLGEAREAGFWKGNVIPSPFARLGGRSATHTHTHKRRRARAVVVRGR